jgi:branched-chain amino acid transport system permease protein
VTLFFDAVIAGLVIGSIYGLVGIGYTVVFNATRVFNLAQGDLVMVGVMTSYYVLDVLKLPQIADLVLILVFVAAVALFEERTVVRIFLKKSGAASFGWFIATLGFSAAVETIVLVSFGNHPIVKIGSPFPLRGFHVGGVIIGYRQILVIGTFIAVIAFLDLFYRRTWTGQAMRGTAEDRRNRRLRDRAHHVLGSFCRPELHAEGLLGAGDRWLRQHQGGGGRGLGAWYR